MYSHGLNLIVFPAAPSTVNRSNAEQFCGKTYVYSPATVPGPATWTFGVTMRSAWKVCTAMIGGPVNASMMPDGAGAISTFFHVRLSNPCAFQPEGKRLA